MRWLRWLLVFVLAVVCAPWGFGLVMAVLWLLGVVPNVTTMIVLGVVCFVATFGTLADRLTR